MASTDIYSFFYGWPVVKFKLFGYCQLGC